MKQFLTFILVIIGFNIASAQQTEVNTYAITNNTDSTVVATVKPTLDSLLIGVNIVNYVELNNSTGSVTVNHPSQIDSLLVSQTISNAEKKINGYRIRLFFDNKQTARTESEQIEEEFKLRFPTIPIYRTYTNPFFKIVIGDYRTKSEATKALKTIVQVYPKAIIVKENISFPEI
ncbi:MAG: SPOR domain-containing protein [Bacteroidales bacterium]|nr:SPOR domain-containing protein [Bacteroidales bacterium]